MAIKVDRIISTEGTVTTSPWFPLNYRGSSFTATIGLTMTSAAVPDYRIEYTMDASAISNGTTPVVTGFLIANAASATAFRQTFPVVATRVVISAFTSGGDDGNQNIRLWIVQNNV